MPGFDSAVSDILPELVAFRHDLHAHPELAYDEHRTSERIGEALAKIPGLSVRKNVAGTGVVATLNADADGPCVALRADMDALPIAEANTFDHKSTLPGRMHACGHDGHMTCLLGAARVLASKADELPGKVKFIFQPAEENGAGARRMIEDGALENPKVDAIFALHGWPDAELGSVVVGTGPILASATMLEIELRGTGTHAAYPHHGDDLILAASHMITALQAIASRMCDPIDSVVVSICSIHAGDAQNVLPAHCVMRGTTRAMRLDVHERVQTQLRRTVESVAAMFGIEATVSFRDTYPPTINDEDAAALVAEAAHELLGPDHVDMNPKPSLGGEDFSFYGQVVPAALWRLGLRPPGCDNFPKLHHPEFDFCDQAIPIGVSLHCRTAHRFLTRAQQRAESVAR